jgi:O-methyltransferase
MTKSIQTQGPEAMGLYLDLLKKTLRFELWDDPGKPIEVFADRARIFCSLVRAMARLLAKARLRIVVLRDMERERREPGSPWPSWAHTMVGPNRLNNIQTAVETILKENIPGDLIETGVWRGGSCILMRALLKIHNEAGRKVFVADSFEGLPKPNPDQYPSDEGDPHHLYSGYLGVSKEQVAENFRKYGLLDDRVVFLKGWFKDTLPTAPIQKLAMMRLDGDMYESTMDALKALYDKLSPGGFCIIDDYVLPNCRAAVEDFRKKRGITEPLIEIDQDGRYWRKQQGVS